MSIKPVINQSFTKYNYTSGNSGRKFIVLHFTSNNGDTAKNNIDFFNGAYRGASAHFFCDTTSIWQNVDLNNTAWHCGAKVYYNNCRNSNSIGIEMCSRKDAYGNYYIEEATVKNAIALTKWLMDLYDIPIQNVVRHYDVTHKWCPGPWVDNPALFDSFKASLMSTVLYAPPTGIYRVNATTLNIRDNASLSANKISTIPSGAEVNVVEIKYGWGKITYNGVSGYVSMDYMTLVKEISGIITPHWAEKYLEECKNKKWINTPEAWTDYDAYAIKSSSAAFIDNISGGTWSSGEADSSIHWVQPIIISLCGKKIITDKGQWLSTPDSLISKALWLALLCNMKGGVSDRYRDRVTDHWARNCLDTLCDLKVIETPDVWCNDFEAPVTKAMIMASAVKAFS